LENIDRENQYIQIAPLIDEDGSELMEPHQIRYDYLVLAVGSVSNNFGVRGVKENCLYLDSREEADKFRQKLLNLCLGVSRKMAINPDTKELVKVTVVGGGATGVELAAELYNAASALSYYGLEVFDESKLRVTLIEAGPRILPALPETLALAATSQLEKLGVNILTKSQVTEVSANNIHTADGATHKSNLMVWAAGVKAPSFLNSIAGLETNAKDQLLVKPTLQTTLDDRIFAIGDCACYWPEGADRPIPPRAQAAHQMSKTIFTNLVALQNNNRLKPFLYKDKGSLVSLSRFSTVGSLMGNLVGGEMALEGRLARIAYTSLYRMHLIAIHGWISGIAHIAISSINKVIRPRLKLH